MFYIFSQLGWCSVSVDYTNFLDVFFKNDAGWYEKIALYGYPNITEVWELGGYHDGSLVQSSWAFFPLLPKITAGYCSLFNMAFKPMSFILICIFSTLCFLQIFNYAKTKITTNNAFLFTLLFMLFPLHLHYNVYYTEALFLFLIISSILAIDKNKILLLAVLSSLIILTRPNGVIIIVFLFLYTINKYFITIKNNKLVLLKRLMIYIVPLIVFVGYLVYQYQYTGNYFAFATAQKGWEKERIFPLLALFRKGDLMNQFNSIYITIFIAFVILTFKKYSWTTHFLIWTTILIPLSAGSVTSITRYVSILIPVYLVMYSYIQTKNKMVVYSLAFCFAILHIYFLFQWINSQPITY
ncbi:MAG: hypothetical protein H6553_11625 [Chitinophagales bacterium]|nr:hypothetical protein [Chitinophagales bacterium]